jgi:hypothetical protein
MQEIWPNPCQTHNLTDRQEESALLGHEHRPSCI